MTTALYLKHRIATSGLAGPIGGARDKLKRMQGSKNPELSMLHNEDRIMEAHLTSLVKRGMKCLDIGGHIGSVSHQLEGLAGRGNLHIIEAVPGKAEWLKKRFGAQNVTACAISEMPGETTFYVNDKNPGFSSLTETPGSHPINVVCNPLDDLFETEVFDFIKIDVEGHELPVLRSGEKLLTRSRPTMLFEAGPTKSTNGETYDELFQWLTADLGYDIFAAFQYGHAAAEPLTLEKFRMCRTYPYLAFNYFAVPRP